MFDHLCSYTFDGIARDPHRLSDFLRKERPESHEDPPGKGRRKNTHSVCIYIWLPLGGEVAKEKKFFFFELIPSPSPPMYIASERWPRKGSIFF